MKTTRHSLMAKGIMVLLSLLVLIFAFTYSWLTVNSPPVYASTITASTQRGVDFEVAVGFSTKETQDEYVVSEFGSDLDFEHLTVIEDNESHDYSLLYDFSPKDVTGNGRKLYIPILQNNSETGRKEINTAASNYQDITPNKEYLSFDLIFKSEVQNCRVYLGNEAFVRAKCETSVGDGNLKTVYSSEQAQKYGQFSPDAVVGAVRVAFVGYQNPTSLTYQDIYSNIADDSHLNSTASLIWLPRPDVCLYQGAGRNDPMTLLTDIPQSTPTAQYDVTYTPSGSATSYTFKDTYTHRYWDVGIGGTQNYVYVTDTVTDPADASSRSFALLGTPVVNETTGRTEYYGKARVNIWIEGTDDEARRAIAGGEFYIQLDLSAG